MALDPDFQEKLEALEWATLEAAKRGPVLGGPRAGMASDAATLAASAEPDSWQVVMTGKPTSWWTDEKDGSLHGQDDCGITVAYVRFAKPGDVEGGLGALARFLIETQGAKAPPLAPGGWYWQGTVEKRGVWNRPQGPFETAEEARVACESYSWREA